MIEYEAYFEISANLDKTLHQIGIGCNFDIIHMIGSHLTTTQVPTWGAFWSQMEL